VTFLQINFRIVRSIKTVYICLKHCLDMLNYLFQKRIDDLKVFFSSIIGYAKIWEWFEKWRTWKVTFLQIYFRNVWSIKTVYICLKHCLNMLKIIFQKRIEDSKLFFSANWSYAKIWEWFEKWQFPDISVFCKVACKKASKLFMSA